MNRIAAELLRFGQKVAGHVAPPNYTGLEVAEARALKAKLEGLSEIEDLEVEVAEARLLDVLENVATVAKIVITK